MAAEITHLVLAEKVFGRHFADKNKKKFFIGTLFPDIRYLGAIERNKTHFRNLKLAEIRNESSFWAGLKFHSFVDENRSRFLRNYPTISELLVAFRGKKIANIDRCLKLLEDELLYKKINNWQMYVKFLDDILSEELLFNIAKETIKKWHRMLQNYFSRQPTNEARKKLLLAMGFPESKIKQSNKIINKMKSNEAVCQLVEDFYDYF